MWKIYNKKKCIPRGIYSHCVLWWCNTKLLKGHISQNILVHVLKKCQYCPCHVSTYVTRNQGSDCKTILSASLFTSS